MVDETLPYKWKLAIDAFVNGGLSRHDALLEAGYASTTALSKGADIFNDPRSVRYMEELRLKRASKYSNQMEDIVSFWGAIMNDPNAKSADRLKASENLAKILGMFVVTGKASDKAPIITGGEDIQD